MTMTRLHARWPLVLAGIVCVYAIVLLGHAFRSQEQLRVSADARMVADSQRRAAGLGDFAADKRERTARIAKLHELHTYLANKALGMSPLYGLDASLGAVEQRFEEHIGRDMTVGGAAFTRVTWIGVGGEVLVDTGHDTASAAALAAATPRAPLTLDLERRLIVTAAPVEFKGEPAGTIVAVSDIGQLYRSLIQTVAEGSYRETLVTSDGREITAAGRPHAFSQTLASALARAPVSKPTPFPTLDGEADDSGFHDAIAIVNPVPGVPALLVTTLSRSELYGHLTSTLFLLSLSGFPLLLLVAALRVTRLQGRARALELDAARADAHNNLLQGRNDSLAGEIRHRQAVEAELQQHRNRLEELVARRTAELNRLFHALPDIYFRMSRDGTVLEHRAGREADRFPMPERLLGRKMQDLVPREIAPELSMALCDVAHGTDERLAEFEIVLPATGRQFYEARVLPLDQDQIVMVVRNVTERRQLEDIREANRQEAERLARVKTEFLANMSHEIRTPLNAVLGLAQIGSRTSSSPDALEHFQGIHDAGRHLLGIVDDILDFSKLEAGKLSVERRAFRLASAVDAVVGLVSGRTAAKSLAMPVKLAPDLPEWVEGDALRLKQILVNLLSNAVKFTDQGRVALSVSAEAGGFVVFEVSDTGIGMDASVVRRLFQPFEQADGSTTRRFGGTGLGLAISHNLATLMGGTIDVRSEPGTGSTFTLRVPLPEARAVEAPVHGDVAEGPRLAGLCVLAAEDNEVNRLVLKAQLEGEGCRVVFARNGNEAIAHVRTSGLHRFQAILMDMQMPVMDGIEATRRLRDMGVSTPIIGLTAHALTEERMSCLAAGMVDHVTKPVEIDRLVECILLHAGARTLGDDGRAHGEFELTGSDSFGT